MLILVRHGQTSVNAEGRLQGRADPPLTDLGQAQAAALAEVVRAAGVTRVVTSPLLRARQTADALAGDLPVTVDERWVEIDYGSLDGLAFNEVPPDVWDRWRNDPGWAPERGESHDDVSRRVAAACADLLGIPPAPGAPGTLVDRGHVAVVSHVSPIKAAVTWALGVPPTVSARMFLGLASVCRIDLSPNGYPVLRSFNETAHL